METVNTDVLIVGAGPTGLTLAYELVRRNITVKIIDKKSGPSQSSKASNIQPRTLEQFGFIDIQKEILEKASKLTGQNIYIGHKLVSRFHLSHLNVLYPFILIIPQSDTEKVLLQKLNENGCFVEWNKELINFTQQQSSVNAEVQSDGQKEHIQAQYLVSCEGAHSRVRKLLKLTFTGATYEEEFLLADLEIGWDLPHKDTHAWFHKDGLLIALPLPNSNKWRLFADVSTRKHKGGVPKASLEMFKQLMHTRTHAYKATLSPPIWMSNFKINRRMVNQYNIGNVFLAGDAAHIHSPFGGQGMNTSIQDALNLGWKLSMVIKKQAPDSLLSTYEEERLPIAQKVLKRTNFNAQLLFPKTKFLIWFRDNIITRILALGQVQTFLLNRNSQLQIHYRKSSLSKEVTTSSCFYRKKLQAGERAPQAHIKSIDKQQSTTLFDLLQTTKFTLFLFFYGKHDLDIASKLLLMGKKHEQSINIHLITDTKSSATTDIPTWLDLSNEVRLEYGIKKSGMVLIRPDGYLAFKNSPLDWQAFENYWNTHFYNYNHIH